MWANPTHLLAMFRDLLLPEFRVWVINVPRKLHLRGLRRPTSTYNTDERSRGVCGVLEHATRVAKHTACHVSGRLRGGCEDSPQDENVVGLWWW